jgi:hypothetical protein
MRGKGGGTRSRAGWYMVQFTASAVAMFGDVWFCVGSRKGEAVTIRGAQQREERANDRAGG